MEYPGVKDLACSEHGIFHKHKNSKNKQCMPFPGPTSHKEPLPHEHLSITYSIDSNRKQHVQRQACKSGHTLVRNYTTFR